MKEKRKVRFYDNAKRRHETSARGYGFDEKYKEFCRINYLRNKRFRVFRPEREKWMKVENSAVGFSKKWFNRIREAIARKLASRKRNKRAKVARRVMRANA